MGRDIVVIGGSAGALQPVIQIVRGLPRDLPAAVFVVLHTSVDTPGMLPQLFSNGSTLTAGYAKDHQAIRHGHVFIAPADHHLLVDDGWVRVTRGPRENGFRPAVDPLFRTAAEHFGPRVVGIILSGGHDDGTNGLALVKRHGGIAIAQHLEDALVGSMPLSAMRAVEVDHVVPAAQMIGIIMRLARESPQEDGFTMARKEGNGRDRAERGLYALKDESFAGPPSGFTCPECGGALWELKDGDLLRFACHVGHSYSPESLLNGKAATLEPVLWTALRALEENGGFLRRMSQRAREQGLGSIAEGYAGRAEEIERRAEVVRSVLVDQPEPTREAAELTRERDSVTLADAPRRKTPVREPSAGRARRRGRAR